MAELWAGLLGMALGGSLTLGVLELLLRRRERLEVAERMRAFEAHWAALRAEGQSPLWGDPSDR